MRLWLRGALVTLCLEPDEHRERCVFVANHAGPCSHETAARIAASLRSVGGAYDVVAASVEVDARNATRAALDRGDA